MLGGKGTHTHSPPSGNVVRYPAGGARVAGCAAAHECKGEQQAQERLGHPGCSAAQAMHRLLDTAPPRTVQGCLCLNQRTGPALTYREGFSCARSSWAQASQVLGRVLQGYSS